MRLGWRVVLLSAAVACSSAATAATPAPANTSAAADKPGAIPTPAASANSRSLVGAWYGDASTVDTVDTGDAGDHLTVLNADGTFVSYFRICKNGIVQPAVVETGRWSVDGNVERTDTLTVNGQRVKASDYYVEHYALRWLSPDTVQKTSRKSGEVHRARRLQTGVAVPSDPCPAASRRPQH
ncbi:lipocalin family protein [Tahibacter caeni]|uniref:lipocalin family protein n=1 Tax=Tahibacter caeni TaxID=1453545 RepID=UPI0021479B21|nr:lipocalin family protein [Tahibacter caeni]